jgi:hypothetical protein
LERKKVRLFSSNYFWFIIFLSFYFLIYNIELFIFIIKTGAWWILGLIKNFFFFFLSDYNIELLIFILFIFIYYLYYLYLYLFFLEHMGVMNSWINKKKPEMKQLLTKLCTFPSANETIDDTPVKQDPLQWGREMGRFVFCLIFRCFVLLICFLCFEWEGLCFVLIFRCFRSFNLCFVFCLIFRWFFFPSSHLRNGKVCVLCLTLFLLLRSLQWGREMGRFV